MTLKTVTVDAEALRDVLQAILGVPYEIRELQAIRPLGNSSIDKLVEQFNEQIKTHNKEQKVDPKKDQK